MMYVCTGGEGVCVLHYLTSVTCEAWHLMCQLMKYVFTASTLIC